MCCKEILNNMPEFNTDKTPSYAWGDFSDEQLGFRHELDEKVLDPGKIKAYHS